MREGQVWGCPPLSELENKNFTYVGAIVCKSEVLNSNLESGGCSPAEALVNVSDNYNRSKVIALP